MTILVTGAAGFIGSNFVLDWFLQSREEVIILGPKNSYPEAAKFTFSRTLIKGFTCNIFKHWEISK